MRVWLNAIIASKWLLVKVVLSSQWVLLVNILVSFSLLTNSGGKLISRSWWSMLGSSSNGMVLCHVGRNNDMWLAFESTPNDKGTCAYDLVSCLFAQMFNRIHSPWASINPTLLGTLCPGRRPAPRSARGTATTGLFPFRGKCPRGPECPVYFFLCSNLSFLQILI